MFDAKTVQRMELLVLSTLQWRMNPVTPMSFLDHIVRRFELIGNLHWEFLKRCEDVILSIVTGMSNANKYIDIYTFGVVLINPLM